MRRYLAPLAGLALVISFSASPVWVGPTAGAQAVSPGQKLAMLTKPSVVRIYDGYIGQFFWGGDNRTYTVAMVGSGSGSFISPDGYIITNAHVTDTTKQGEEKAKEALIRQFIVQLAQAYNDDPRTVLANENLVQTILSKTRLVDLKHIHHVITPDGSPFPFEIKAFGAPVGAGKDVAVIKIEVKNAPVLKIGDADKLQLQDHITVFGYPGAADTFDSGILDQKSALEASITDGKLSAKKNAADGAPILQVSAPATHGNSGGPVLNDSGEVVGLLTFRGDTVGGQEVSGFAFVVPSSTMLEFVRQSGGTNTQGIVDERYREGLELYWDGYYTAAIEKFQEVKRLFPQHSEVDRLITASQQAKSEGRERSSFPMWAVIAIALVLFVIFLVVVGVIVALVLRRGKRKRLAPAGAPGAAPFPPQARANVPSAGVPAYPSPSPAPPFPNPEKTIALAAAGANPGFAAAQPSLGTLMCTHGALAGQRFDIRPEGVYIGRDGSLSQVVIPDGRVSKRHVWIGPRNGRVAVVDQQSTNGTFLNVPGSQRVAEAMLNPGDTVILSEADVARFQYQR
jgi:S1-C subfamily serine protease